MLLVVLRRFFFVAAALMLPAAALAAHGTTPLKVVEEMEIDAQPAKVWAVVADFQNWTWLPGVAKIEGTGGNTPDQAKRRLTLSDSGVVEETLTKFDAERMSLGYHVESIDLKNLPATNYSAIVTVRAAEGGKSNVEWKGRFYRGYPNANPPPELSDEVAERAVTKLHKASLAALKARVEGK
jgi:carbon monoxide dehydrogenase subunit G